MVCGCGTKLSHQISYDGGVADLGFCYADSRQTGSGYDSKTFVPWKRVAWKKKSSRSI